MSRLVALCESGPLDGQSFSVTEAAPLFSRAHSGELYVPSSETAEGWVYVPAPKEQAAALLKEHWAQFPDLDEEGNPLERASG